MKYIAPEMEVRELDVDDIIMSNEDDNVVEDDGTVNTPGIQL